MLLLGAKNEQRCLAIRAYVGVLLFSLLVARVASGHDLFSDALEAFSDVAGLSLRLKAW